MKKNLWSIRHVHSCGNDIFLMEAGEEGPTKEQAVEAFGLVLEEDDSLLVRKLNMEGGKCVVLCESNDINPHEPVEEEVAVA